MSTMMHCANDSYGMSVAGRAIHEGRGGSRAICCLDSLLLLHHPHASSVFSSERYGRQACPTRHFKGIRVRLQ